MKKEYKLENSEETINDVHDEARCAGKYCAVHNPSDHHMRSWKQQWRDDRRIIVRVCPKHNVRHPDPDNNWEADSYFWVHRCCGCCKEPKKGYH